MSAPHWSRAKALCGMDTETTGVSVWTDRIVTAAVVDVQPQARPVMHRWVIDPGVDIPAEAAAIHGWTTDRIRSHPDAREPAEALFEIGGMVALNVRRGVPLVLFNAVYDLTLFEVECVRHQVPTLADRLGRKTWGPVIDGMVIDKAMSRRKGKRRLGDVCAFYGVALPGAHDSSVDALAACRLVPVLVERYADKLAGFTAEQLHNEQVAWRRAQQADFREWLLRQDSSKDVSDIRPEWPVLPVPTKAGVA